MHAFLKARQNYVYWMPWSEPSAVGAEDDVVDRDALGVVERRCSEVGRDRERGGWPERGPCDVDGALVADDATSVGKGARSDLDRGSEDGGRAWRWEGKRGPVRMPLSLKCMSSTHTTSK